MSSATTLAALMDSSWGLLSPRLASQSGKLRLAILCAKERARERERGVREGERGRLVETFCWEPWGGFRCTFGSSCGPIVFCSVGNTDHGLGEASRTFCHVSACGLVIQLVRGPLVCGI